MPPKRRDIVGEYIKKRNIAMNNLKRIRHIIMTQADPLSVTELQCRLDLFEGYFQDIREHQASIEEFQLESELDAAQTIREEFEDLYCEVKSKILSLISVMSSLQKESTSGQAKIPFEKDNLPKLKLPQFSGKYSEYQNFIHLFSTLVDSKDHLSQVEKYNHLLSCLTGSALRTVKALDLSEENYATALELLKSRYDNKFLMCQEHIKDLFNLPRVQKGSPENLRALIDNVSSHYNALCSLMSHEEITNSLMVHLALSSTDLDTQSKVEEAIDYNKRFTWDDCVKVLIKRCQMLETRGNKPSESGQQKNQLFGNKNIDRKFQRSALNAVNINCSICNQSNHQIWKCSKFLELQPTNRFDAIKKLGLCINCFSKQHTVKQCRASSCRQCNGMHHTLLHRGNLASGGHAQQQLSPHQFQSSSAQVTEAAATNEVAKTSLISQDQSTTKCLQQLRPNEDNFTLLATAVVKITDKYGVQHNARALLDSASQSNFMTQHLANLLKLDKVKTNNIIGGIGEREMCAKYSTTAHISSHFSNFETVLQCIILPRITGSQPNRKIAVDSWKIPEHIYLADAKFNVPQQVDLLIGAGTFFQLLRGNQIQLGSDLPTLFETQFGWIVSGTCHELDNRKSVLSASTSQDPETALETIVQRFWELEAVPESARKWTKEQTLCEEHFLQHTKRLECGRFMVKLPLKQSPSVLGDSKEMAIRRFRNQEKRLQHNVDVKAAYTEFLLKYENEGHMAKSEWPDPASHPCFLPHHCVLRPEKSTTKCRVVFDASAKTTTNLSLNNILMVGPVVQNELFDVLIRFRLHLYGLMADISAMYRQILVYPEDQNLQHIIWRNNVSDKLQVFKLKTVTYGTASAPYLATRCLVQLAEDNNVTLPNAAKIVKNDFYVDDLITGGSTLEEIKIIKNHVSIITSQGQFVLRKWYSNHQQFLEEIPIEEREKPIKLNNCDVVKALGIIWDASSDVFKFQYSSDNIESANLTKRKVLSELAKLFDPLGLIKPVVTKAKIFMQELWLKKLNWDDIIPEEQSALWIGFVNQLVSLNKLTIPRFVLQQNSTIELHGFCDSSTRAYGCCYYIRCIDAHGNIKVSLYTAKSKVAPISTVRSIPCLELCAAHLMTQVWQKLQNIFRWNKVVMWSDNITVLSWLAEHASNFNTFVANRASFIQEHTVGVKWKYVPSSSNPADIISRGATVKDLINSIWFTGPAFLQNAPDSWPKHPKKCQINELPERRLVKTTLTSVQSNVFFEALLKTHNFIKICTRIAYVRRFIKNCRLPTHRRTTTTKEVTATELDEAFIQLVVIIQQIHYGTEIKALLSKNQISSNSLLKSLNPFLEEVYGLQVLKVGGRLRHAELPYEAKCPIILPKDNNFVRSYVQHLHIRNINAGPQALLSAIRQRCWIIGAREYARKVVQKCVHCFRYRPKMMSQIMGDLPKERVSSAKPFSHCGVDFCGPILTTWRIRGKPRYKSYIAVFVCFVTRAVHLEVVSDLTADAFLAALKRFIGRRGLCSNLYLDNATNFVGARNKLKEFKEAFLKENVQRDVMKWCATNSINFKHIPPRSPHFGGLWEAAVKSAKNILYKTMQSAILTFEELSTVAAQIEGILNSRPLTAMTNDPSDEAVLTPAHFLNQASQGCIVEPIQSFSKISCLKVWQQLAAIQQHFWTRWSKEYLTALQQRQKWSSEKPNVNVGDMVLIHEDNVPPQKWIVGRIINVILGNDKKVRVADVKTSSGIFRRAIA